ncbi:CBS domain-containing protein [Streptomyces sp. NPDC058620]|uniref:CBS domain-containing protein n=1 Tax=Streptomyces sp. NPDC058620 TaxID=3346560 RepID=UPI00364A6595
MPLVTVGWICLLCGAPGGLWLVFVGFFNMVVAGAERRRAALHTAVRGCWWPTVRRLAAVPGDVARAATPLSQYAVAAPGDLLNEALDRLSLRTGMYILVLVADAGHLVGIVSAKDIARLMQRHTLGGNAPN